MHTVVDDLRGGGKERRETSSGNRREREWGRDWQEREKDCITIEKVSVVLEERASEWKWSHKLNAWKM